MAAASFFGHFFLGVGPGVAFFLIVIAPKSFVVLLSLFSAFLWLMVLLFTSAVFRGFEPLHASQPAYSGALLAAVAIEEAARVGVWQLNKRTLAVLHRMSVSSGHSFTKLDELYLALGWGYGQAAVHVLFMFASLLPLTVGHGTVYHSTCPQLSVFLVGALNSLGMGATLVALSVVALDAWSRDSLPGKAFAPLMHAAAALLTLGSFRQGGCTTAVAAQVALGLANTWYAASIAWKQGISSSSPSSGGGRSSRRQMAAVGADTVALEAWLPAPEPIAAAGVAAGGRTAAAAAAAVVISDAAAAVVTSRTSLPASLRSRAT